MISLVPRSIDEHQQIFPKASEDTLGRYEGQFVDVVVEFNMADGDAHRQRPAKHMVSKVQKRPPSVDVAIKPSLL